MTTEFQEEELQLNKGITKQLMLAVTGVHDFGTPSDVQNAMDPVTACNCIMIANIQGGYKCPSRKNNL